MNTNKAVTDEGKAPLKAYRIWSLKPYRIFYVAQVKGDGGKDWGYTTKAVEAIALNKYWQRRFASDCRFVGSQAIFI